jgi:hypothetical protein
MSLVNPNERQVAGTHYLGGEFQHWDWVIDNQLGYLEGQITKYLCRWRAKGGVKDLEKSLHYTDKLVESVVRGRLPLPEERKVKNLASMKDLYHLSETEASVFRLVAEYSTVSSLMYLQELVAQILANATQR